MRPGHTCRSRLRGFRSSLLGIIPATFASLLRFRSLLREVPSYEAVPVSPLCFVRQLCPVDDFRCDECGVMGTVWRTNIEATAGLLPGVGQVQHACLHGGPDSI